MRKLNNLKIFIDKYDRFGVNNCNCKCRQCRYDYEFDCRSSSEDYKNIRQHEIDKEIIEEILEGSSDEFIQVTIALVKKVRVNHPDFTDLDAEEVYEGILGAIEVLNDTEKHKNLLEYISNEIGVKYEIVEEKYLEGRVLYGDKLDKIFSDEVIATMKRLNREIDNEITKTKNFLQSLRVK